VRRRPADRSGREPGDDRGSPAGGPAHQQREPLARRRTPPPGPRPGRRQGHQDHQRHPAEHAGAGGRLDVGVPDPAQGERSERCGHGALAAQREHRGGRGVGGRRPGVQQSGDQPRCVAGGHQQERPGGSPLPGGTGEHRHGRRQPRAGAQAAQRDQHQEGRRQPVLVAPASRADQEPRQHGVPHEHRPRAHQQPLGHQRVPGVQRDRDEADHEDGVSAHQPGGAEPARAEGQHEDELLEEHPGQDLVQDRDDRVGRHRPRQPAAEPESVAGQGQVGDPHHVADQQEAGSQRRPEDQQRQGERPEHDGRLSCQGAPHGDDPTTREWPADWGPPQARP
jgi:hypothetical protein